MLTPEEIEDLLTQPEGIELEFKSARVPPSKLGRIISAFANTRGGVIIVGVGAPRTGESIPEMIGVEPGLFQRLVNYSLLHLKPHPEISADCVPIHGKYLGVIRVTATEQVPILHEDQLIVRTEEGTNEVASRHVEPHRRGAKSAWYARRGIWPATIAAALITETLFMVSTLRGKEPVDVIPGSLIVGVGCLFAWAVAQIARPRNEPSGADGTRDRVRQAEETLEEGLRTLDASTAGEASTEQARLALSDLWSVTHRRLDHYHGIALGQAAKSFRNAQIAMTTGFILLVGFAVAGVMADSTAGAVVAGALGTVSAALAGYVSQTFVKSQETSAGHLRAYFDQPLEFSRYLAAERLMADSGLTSEQRARITESLVQAMITGPPLTPNEAQDNPSA
ncbi:RNA-binding domain-containing protein [Streptomyces sp. CA-243310]|uniref:RNA-binding domain-containing protein n=1 Tax=Streptomyces sp. CA-243310 TaxID=3240056 RepID=UPI003D92016A